MVKLLIVLFLHKLRNRNSVPAAGTVFSVFTFSASLTASFTTYIPFGNAETHMQ